MRVPSLFTRGESIVYERCTEVRGGFRNPRLPPSERLSIYVDKVLPDSLKELVPQATRSTTRTSCARSPRFYPQGAGRRLFDFGCGSGGFLLEARKAGFEVMGLELNKDLAAFVESRYGIPVHQGLIDDPSFAGEKFNIILSAQVFEHLLDPARTLLDLKQHLETPGYVLIEVPNQLAIKETLRRGATMDDSHLFYFSARALSLDARGLRLRGAQGAGGPAALPALRGGAKLAALAARRRHLAGRRAAGQDRPLGAGEAQVDARALRGGAARPPAPRRGRHPVLLAEMASRLGHIGGEKVDTFEDLGQGFAIARIGLPRLKPLAWPPDRRHDGRDRFPRRRSASRHVSPEPATQQERNGQPDGTVASARPAASSKVSGAPPSTTAGAPCWRSTAAARGRWPGR